MLNTKVWQKGGSSLNILLAEVSWEQLSLGQSCKCAIRKEKENNPKLSGLLKHESTHDHYILTFKSFIKVNKKNKKIRQQLQRSDQFLAGKYQYFISTRLFQTFQAGLCYSGRFLCAKKINLLLGTLDSHFLNTDVQLSVRVSIFARSIRTSIFARSVRMKKSSLEVKTPCLASFLFKGFCPPHTSAVCLFILEELCEKKRTY